MKECSRCGAATDAASFCRRCGLYLPNTSLGLEAASLWRRFFAWMLDAWILPALTLIIGWFVWFYFTAKHGQTPGKRLLRIRVVNADGSPVTAGRMWLREVVVKMLFYGLAFVSIIATIFLWFFYLRAFWDKDKQAQHDKMVKTVVVGVPEAARSYPPLEQEVPAMQSHPSQTTSEPAMVEEELRRLARLRDEGLITADEFEQKRRSLVETL